jgi:hypothetical protein
MCLHNVKEKAFDKYKIQSLRNPEVRMSYIGCNVLHIERQNNRTSVPSEHDFFINYLICFSMSLLKSNRRINSGTFFLLSRLWKSTPSFTSSWSVGELLTYAAKLKEG